MIVRLFMAAFILCFNDSSFAQENINIPSIPSSEGIDALVSPKTNGKCVVEEKPISEEELVACYGKHFFIMEAFALISDDDFKDKEMKEARKKNIELEYARDKSSVSSCLKKVLQYSTENNPQEDHEFMLYRMSEISEVAGF